MPQNIILSIIIAIFFASVLSIRLAGAIFDKKIRREVDDLLAESPLPPGKAFSYEDLEGLPEPVQRYLKRSIKEGQKAPRNVELKHVGKFRTKMDQRWMPIEGEEHFAVAEPGFVWRGRLKVAPLVWIEARDCYRKGFGNMLIKLFSAITIADSQSEEMDQSSLLRWLSEIAWNPGALIACDRLSWDAIDSGSAKATVQDGKLKATATFYFDEEGKVTKVVSNDKFRYVDGKFLKGIWTGLYGDYRECGGFLVPFEAEAIWNLEEGDFSYARFEVTEVDYGR